MMFCNSCDRDCRKLQMLGRGIVGRRTRTSHSLRGGMLDLMDSFECRLQRSIGLYNSPLLIHERTFAKKNV